MANRIVVMNAGRVEQVGGPTEVYRRPSTPFVACFVGQMNFLFFQAEDGIRGGRVTGVQTCALPISERAIRMAVEMREAVVRLQVDWRRRGRVVGRASSSEREEISVVAVSLKKK